MKWTEARRKAFGKKMKAAWKKRKQIENDVVELDKRLTKAEQTTTITVVAKGKCYLSSEKEKVQIMGDIEQVITTN